MIKQLKSSPFTTAGKSFENNCIFMVVICVYHEGVICKSRVACIQKKSLFNHIMFEADLHYSPNNRCRPSSCLLAVLAMFLVIFSPSSYS